MVETNHAADELRPEYHLSQLKGGVRGKYATEPRIASNLWLLCVASICGAVPLTLGTAIYIAYRNNRHSGLEGAGLLNILGGLVLFGIGCICLVTYISREDKINRARWIPLQLQSALVGGLLLLNFPMAIAYVSWSLDLMGQYLVRVANDTELTIDSFVLDGPGTQIELGPVGPRSAARRYLDFNGDGPLSFSARQGDLQFGGQVEGYVTGGFPGDATVHVQPNGQFVIQHERTTPNSIND